MKHETIAVVGAGNGGCAIAGWLASQGAAVDLCDLFPQYLKDPEINGGIELTLEGVTTHQPLHKLTILTERICMN